MRRVADAEARFRRLASAAANEVGTLAAIVDEDVRHEPPPSSRPELYLASIDLTDTFLADKADDEPQTAQAKVDQDLRNLSGCIAHGDVPQIPRVI